MRDNEGILITPPKSARRKRAHYVGMVLKVCEEHIALSEMSLSERGSAFDDFEEHSEEEEN